MMLSEMLVVKVNAELVGKYPLHAGVHLYVTAFRVAVLHASGQVYIRDRGVSGRALSCLCSGAGVRGVVLGAIRAMVKTPKTGIV